MWAKQIFINLNMILMLKYSWSFAQPKDLIKTNLYSNDKDIFLEFLNWKIIYLLEKKKKKKGKNKDV